MSLSTGEKLGPYEILAPLGAGGMGEVYKARDTRLDRVVAIKVLPEHIALREELRARFEREARAVGSLNHPHICVLHDIGPGYMVMELVEGETLAARIERGPIPLQQALRFAAQIAEALDRAHRAGVTHRDVKPQNIMLTRDGVKVLDFGLAKSTAKPGPTEQTLTKVLTMENTVMGTPQYMAPEQFEGKEADARSDIWAFGAVLYEMVTGQKPFQGKSYSSLVGAILSTDPPPMLVKPFTPAWLERIVRRCLAKDPEDRWQSMRDVVIELRTTAQESAPAATPKTARLPWAIAICSTIALLGAGILLYRATRPDPPRPLMRLNLEIAPGTPLARVDTGTGTGTGGHMLAISPDGTRLALALRSQDGKVRLHTRLLNQSQVTPIAGTENAHSPFFSPGGDWIGFFADAKLKKVAAGGGAVVTLCDAPTAYGGSWGDDGNIIAALNFSSYLSRVPFAGGEAVPVTKLTASDVTHRWPQVLPGSKAVLFTTANQTGAGYHDANIEVASLETGERKVLVRGFFGRYLGDATHSSPLGYLLFVRQNTLFAARFHTGRLALVGSPTPILEDLSSTPGAGGDGAFALDGTFVYLSAKAAQQSWSISHVDRSGVASPLHAPPGQYFNLHLSPNGKRLAFSIGTDKGSDVWVKDLDRSTPVRISSLPGSNSFPVWTPDGQGIVFRSTSAGAPGLYWVRSDGSGKEKRLTEGKSPEFPYAFSPDGKRLFVTISGKDGSRDIFTRPVESEPGPAFGGIRLGDPERFLETPFDERTPSISPDGRWVAYGSNESGTLEVYVRPFPGPGGRSQISAGGGSTPVWSRVGRELLYVSADQRVMGVGYTVSSESFVAGTPRVWAEARLRSSVGSLGFDLAADGKHVAAILADDPSGDKPPTQLTILLNFLDELRRRLPVDGY